MATVQPPDDAFRQFARAGLERLAVDCDEDMLAVMAFAETVYGPHVQALLAADLDAVEPEPDADMSSPPREAAT